MKVLYLHQYFRVGSYGTRSFEFSKHLINKGSQVTMISGRKGNSGVFDGINVKFTQTNYNHMQNYLKRILSFIHYIIKSTIIGLKEKNLDIIYATSTPLTVGIPAIIISKLKRKPYVFEVRDVWPDVPIELGIIKTSFFAKNLFFIEKFIYRNANHIIVLSDGMKQNLLQKGVKPSKITVITNLSYNKYYDNDEIEKVRSIQRNKIKCIHHGTMGLVNGLDFILDVAKQYPNKKIEYYLIGEGNQKERLKKRIKDEKIPHVYIKDAMSKDKILKEIMLSDVGIMSVENYKILEDNSANKFFDYLASGLPVLINYKGWQKEVLEKNEAGKSFNYNDKKGFYEFLVDLKNNKELRRKYGRNSKKLGLEKYDSVKLANQFEYILRNTM